MTMAGAHGVTWLHLSNFLQDYSKGSVAAENDNLIIGLDECPFLTLVVKTTIHPSYPINISLQGKLEATVEMFREQYD